MAESLGRVKVSVKGDHYNFKHPESRFIVTTCIRKKTYLWDEQSIR